ncbi:MAG: hypothetical protein AAGA28_18750 [Pseudomonadota bacterium]
MTQRPNYEEMDPEARFDAVENLATTVFGTPSWRDATATEFDIHKQTISNWKTTGRTPVWICVALYHLMMRQSLERALLTLRGS